MTLTTMREEEFKKIVKPGSYQVFLFTSPAPIPFSFAQHPWFVVNDRSTLSRWEVIFRTTAHPTSWGHLHKNFYTPIRGVELFPYFFKWHWEGTFLGVVENEIAQLMAAFIELSPKTYPFCYKYFLTGPNSNTYVQWVLANFSKSGLKLPANAIGKHFSNTPRQAIVP